MPTGYTAKVQNGEITDPKEYILNCARNFGALIHMRDSDSCEIEKRKVDNYYLERMESSIKDYQDFIKLSDDEIEKRINKEYDEAVLRQEKGLNSFYEHEKRYQDMIEKVSEWVAPTGDHVQLKDFAINQLKTSLEYDCSDYLRKSYLKKIEKQTIEEYKASMIQNYLEDIEYNSKHYKEELERVKEVNKWIDELINSFEE